jgi:flagellar hook-basal body complex protein FliE
MYVNPVASGLSGLGGLTPKPAPTGQAMDGFGKALFDAVQSLDAAQQEADGKSAALAAGQPVELHDVMIAQDRASLGMNLALQVRNKLVESYQEVMRMQL